MTRSITQPKQVTTHCHCRKDATSRPLKLTAIETPRPLKFTATTETEHSSAKNSRIVLPGKVQKPWECYGSNGKVIVKTHFSSAKNTCIIASTFYQGNFRPKEGSKPFENAMV